LNIPGVGYTYGIHPWFLNEENFERQLALVEQIARLPFIIALGEAGFDRLRGPSAELQRIAFEEQIVISEELKKPVVIHCVRAWDELLSSRKKLKARMPWLVHGYRGNYNLASQLLAKGMYLSFWYDFVIRPEAAKLLKQLPTDRIFLETDGAEIDIRNIYEKVAIDLNLSVEELKSITQNNFNTFFS
jgi:TatD DNase family protein